MGKKTRRNLFELTGPKEKVLNAKSQGRGCKKKAGSMKVKKPGNNSIFKDGKGGGEAKLIKRKTGQQWWVVEKEISG